MPDNKIKDVFGTLPPESPHYSEPPDDENGEVSKVIDMSGMFRKTEKMERLLLRMAPPIARIPEVESKVDAASERVTRVEEKVENHKEKIDHLDSRVGIGGAHDCFQVDVIAELKNDQRSATEKIIDTAQVNIMQRAKLEELTKDSEEVTKEITEIKRAPQKLLFVVASMIFTILLTAGGAIWFLAELSKDVEFERAQRTEQIKRIEKQIKGVAKAADPAPVVKEVKVLQQAVEDSTKVETAYNDMCKGMTTGERRALTRVFRRRGKRIPVSCVEL